MCFSGIRDVDVYSVSMSLDYYILELNWWSCSVFCFSFYYIFKDAKEILHRIRTCVFLSEFKYLWCLPTMYVYCLYIVLHPSCNSCCTPSHKLCSSVISIFHWPLEWSVRVIWLTKYFPFLQVNVYGQCQIWNKDE